jgi:hypothetical protein
LKEATVTESDQDFSEEDVEKDRCALALSLTMEVCIAVVLPYCKLFSSRRLAKNDDLLVVEQEEEDDKAEEEMFILLLVIWQEQARKLNL